MKRFAVGENMKIKPIVPWLGSKRRLVSQLIDKMQNISAMWSCSLAVRHYSLQAQ